MKYLPRVDRAGVLRRMGSVLISDKVALRRMIDKEIRWPVVVEKRCCRVQQQWGYSLLPFKSRWEPPEKKRHRKKKPGELEGSEDSLAGFGEVAESNCGWKRSEDPRDDWKVADSATNCCFQCRRREEKSRKRQSNICGNHTCSAWILVRVFYCNG